LVRQGAAVSHTCAQLGAHRTLRFRSDGELAGVLIFPDSYAETNPMAHSSILGGERVAPRARGRDTDALGPSDSSDSGSDVQGERLSATAPDMAGDIDAATLATLDSDTDASGTGERGSAVPDGAAEGADIGTDHIERMSRPGGMSDALDAADVSLDDPQAMEVQDLAVDESDVEEDPDRAAEADRLEGADGH
jgi:hypothetical protein